MPFSLFACPFFALLSESYVPPDRKMQSQEEGWNSWDCYGPAVDEATVRENAEFMAEHLKQHGWEYVVVDIQWSNPTAL